MLFIFGQMQHAHLDKGNIIFVDGYNAVTHGKRAWIDAENGSQLDLRFEI